MTKKEFQKLLLIEQVKKYVEDNKYFDYLNDNLKKAIDKKDISLVPELEEELEFLYNLIDNSQDKENQKIIKDIKTVEKLFKTKKELITKEEFQKLPLIEQVKKYVEDNKYSDYLDDNLKKAIDKKDISLVPKLKKELKDAQKKNSEEIIKDIGIIKKLFETEEKLITKKEFQKLSLINQLEKFIENKNYYKYLDDNLKEAINKKDMTLVPELEEELRDYYFMINASEDEIPYSEKIEYNNKRRNIEKLFTKEKYELNKFLKEKVFYQLSKLNKNNTTYLNALYTVDRKKDKFDSLEIITNYPYKFYHDIRNLSIFESMEYKPVEQQEKIKKEFLYIKIKTDKFFENFENGLLNKKEIEYEDIPEKYLNEIAKQLGIEKEFNIKSISIKEQNKLKNEILKNENIKNIENLTLKDISKDKYEILKKEILKDKPEIEEKELEEKILEKFKEEKEKELENKIVKIYRDKELRNNIEKKLRNKNYKEYVKRKFEELIIEEFKNDINLVEEDYDKFLKNLLKEDKIQFENEITVDTKEKVTEIDNNLRKYKNKILSIIDNNDTMLLEGISYSTKGLDKNQKTMLLDYISTLKEHSKSEKNMLRILKNNVPILPLWGNFDFLKENNEVKSGNLKYGDLFINDIPVVVNEIEDGDKNMKLLNAINEISDKTGVKAVQILDKNNKPTGKIKLENIEGKDKDIYIKTTENGEKISGLHHSHITEYYYNKLKELYNNSNVVHENTLTTFLLDKKLNNEEVYPKIKDNELFAYYYYDKETMQTKVKFGTKEDIEKFTRNTEQKNIINFNNKNTLDIYFPENTKDKNKTFDAKKLIKGVKPVIDPETKETIEGKNLIIPLYKNIFKELNYEVSNLDENNLRNFHAFVTELELELFESPKIGKNLTEKVEEVKKEFNKRLETTFKDDLKQMRLKIKDTNDKTDPKVELMDKNSKYNDPILENEKSEKIKMLLKTISNKTNELDFYLNNNKEQLLNLEKIQKLQREINDKIIELHNFLDKELSDDSIEDKSYTKTLKHFFEKEKPKPIKDFFIGLIGNNDDKFVEKFKKQFLTKQFWDTLESVEKDIYIERRDYLSAINDLLRNLSARSETESELDNNFIIHCIFPIALAPSILRDLVNTSLTIKNFMDREKIYYQQIEKHKKERLIPAVEKTLKETMPFLNKENSEVVKNFVNQFINIDGGSPKFDFKFFRNNKGIYTFSLNKPEEMKDFIQTLIKKYEDSIDINSINTGPGSEIHNIKNTTLNIISKAEKNLIVALKKEMITKLKIDPENITFEEEILDKYVIKFIENIKEMEKNSKQINELEIILTTAKYFEDNLDDFSFEEQKFIKKYIISNKLSLMEQEEFKNKLKKEINKICFDAFDNIYDKYSINGFKFDKNENEIKNKLKETLKLLIEEENSDITFSNINEHINKLISEHYIAILPEINKNKVNIKELLMDPETLIKENINLELLNTETINELIQALEKSDFEQLKKLPILNNQNEIKIENLLITNLQKQLKVNLEDLPFNEKKIMNNLFKEYVKKFKEKTDNFSKIDNLQEVVKEILDEFEQNIETNSIERQKVIKKYFINNKENLLNKNFNKNIIPFSEKLINFNQFSLEDIKLLKNELIKIYFKINVFKDETIEEKVKKFVKNYLPEELKSSLPILPVNKLKTEILENENLEKNRNRETFSFINIFNIYKKHKTLISESRKLQENSKSIKTLKEKYEHTVDKKVENKEKSDKTASFNKNRTKFERNF